MRITAYNNAFLFKLALASLFIFIITALLVFVSGYTSTDDFVFEGIQDSYSVGYTRFMVFISFLGKHSFLIPANLGLAAFFVLLKKRTWALRVLVISIGGVSLMGLLKNLFARHRPPAPLVEGITNYGFPSGHAMMSLLFYGLLIIFCYSYMKAGWMRTSLLAFLFLLILLIGFSRIYLRVHYTTDVIAGYSFGLFWLCFYLLAANNIERKVRVRRAS